MKRLSVEAARVTLVNPPTEALRASASQARPYNANGIRTIIELYGSDGSTGIAETCGSPQSYLETQRLCRSLIGANPVKIGEIHAILRASTPGGFEHAQAVIGGLENAIWDLVGHHLGAPLYELFGGARSGPFSTPGVIWIGETNGDERPATRSASDVVAATISRAQGLVTEKGCEILLVVACGYSSESDAAILRGLREAFGSGMRLRLECLGRYRLADAASLLQEVEDINLEYAANPVSTHVELEHLRRRIRTPLAIERAVEHHLASAVRTDSTEVILGNSIDWGGIVPFRKNAAVCRAFALDMAVSSWNSVGPSIAAALHLISTHAAVNKGFHGVTADSGRFVVAGDSLLVHDGRMAVPDGPGIGIEIDRALLEVRKREEVLISTPVTAGADR